MEHSEFKPIEAQQQPQQQMESSFGQDFVLLINTIKPWSESEADPNKFFEFINRYISLVETNSNIIVPIIEQIYGSKSQHQNFILAMHTLNPKSFTSVVNLFESILQLRSNNLNPQQALDLKFVKLEYEGRSYLKAILEMIKKLPKENFTVLNQMFLKNTNQMGLNQTAPESNSNNNNSTTNDTMTKTPKKSSSEFLEKEVSLPGTSKKLKTKHIIGIVVLVAIILFGLFYFFYLRGGSSKRGSSSSSIEFNDGGSYISDGAAGGGGGGGSDTSVVFSEG